MILRLLVLGLMMAWGGPAAAQFNMARGGESEIQVYADKGIEWRADANRVIAEGNAKAVRGTMTITADKLVAYYREGQGGNEIWRLDAEGNVVITSPKEKASGPKGTYDLDKAIFVLRGGPTRMDTESDTFTADESMEYWEAQHMAVLRGNAVAIQRLKSKQLKADVITAYFRDKNEKAKPAAKGGKSAPKGPSSTGNMDFQRADAFGHVELTTAQEVITGDKGDYNVETGIATVAGSVKIKREGNELNGGYAHVDLNSGISKLFGGTPGGDGGQRVRGTFMPEKKEGGGQAVFRGNAPKAKSGDDDQAGR